MYEDIIRHLTVPKSIMNKWQRLIDALAQLVDVPTAIIMKYEYPYLEAIISSQTEDNPIPPNYREKIFDKYCEVTIGEKRMHEVINAFKHSKFKTRQDLKVHNLISYLGFPLEWPTGDVFGTICVLDRRERKFSRKQKNLMKEMKLAVDAHLELIYKNEMLKRAQEKIRAQRDNLRLLTSTVRHEIANNLTFIQGFLQLKQRGSELPERIYNKLMPHVESILESVEHIHELEQLFTEEKTFKEMNPRQIIGKIKEEYGEEINVKGSCTVLADEYLDLLLKELIRNAFKHTETSKIDIILTEDEDSARIKVQDYGPGLPEEIIASHFENRKEQRELKGLTIIEKIMERYGGTITYEKNEKGTLFELIWNKEGKEWNKKL
ncbi:MAG: putative Signal transduction histidine kinase containing PAS domain [Promethearchaeota archaeon]|nr:MAG: putative Signal transduction histidine kinase containing PAS domain [Candidatus Lokiarchaeota archaeon]